MVPFGDGWAPLAVVDLLERLPPKRAARLRRLLGERLPAMWTEAQDRHRRGRVEPSRGSDPFTRCLPRP